MKLLQNFIVAFSMYSKIPMPQIEWTKENMKYTMALFPFVGAVIGALEYLWWYVAGLAGFGQMLTAAIAVIIPVIISGGIHLDGLLDTADALSSWQTMERRLEILKDSHAGAFAIITCCAYFLAFFGIMTECDLRCISVIGAGFIYSRILSAHCVCKLKCAKGSGLVHTFSSAADGRRCDGILSVETVLVVSLMIYLYRWPGTIAVLAVIIWYFIYKHVAKKYFGGITGDTQGFFLQIAELVIAFAVIITAHFMV